MKMIQKDDFLSGIFDMEWGKFSGNEHERESVLSALSEGTFQRIDFEISADNFEVVSLLLNNGCFLSSSKVYYSSVKSNRTSQPLDESVCTISSAQSSDAEELAVIANETFVLDRYRNDPCLDNIKTNDLYSAWIHNNINFRCRDIITCKISDEIVGFLCVIEEKEHYYFELVGVKPKYTSKGIGALMIKHALSNYSDKKCICVTQAHNVPMQRLLQKEGFIIYKANYVFSKDYVK